MFLFVLLLEYLYSVIFKGCLCCIFLLLLINKKYIKLTMILFSFLLDVFFNKIFILPLMIILSVGSCFFVKLKNKIQVTIFLVIYFAFIYIYLSDFGILIIFKMVINLLLYFLVIGKCYNHINY